MPNKKARKKSRKRYKIPKGMKLRALLKLKATDSPRVTRLKSRVRATLMRIATG